MLRIYMVYSPSSRVQRANQFFPIFVALLVYFNHR